jgi:hypothetical protein
MQPRDRCRGWYFWKAFAPAVPQARSSQKFLAPSLRHPIVIEDDED